MYPKCCILLTLCTLCALFSNGIADNSPVGSGEHIHDDPMEPEEVGKIWKEDEVLDEVKEQDPKASSDTPVDEQSEQLIPLARDKVTEGTTALKTDAATTEGSAGTEDTITSTTVATTAEFRRAVEGTTTLNINARTMEGSTGTEDSITSTTDTTTTEDRGTTVNTTKSTTDATTPEYGGNTAENCCDHDSSNWTTENPNTEFETTTEGSKEKAGADNETSSTEEFVTNRATQPVTTTESLYGENFVTSFPTQPTTTDESPYTAEFVTNISAQPTTAAENPYTEEFVTNMAEVTERDTAIQYRCCCRVKKCKKGKKKKRCKKLMNKCCKKTSRQKSRNY